MATTTRPGAAPTRLLLLRSAERLFAERGVDGANTREITERAGQANASAVHYHFGSRAGLLRAVLAEHQSRVEGLLAPALAQLGDAAELVELVRAYVAAEASELADDSGRYCLRIVGQLAHETGFRNGEPHATLHGSVLWRLFERVAERLERDCGVAEDIARERVELMVMLVGAAFADRARHVQEGRPLPVREQRYERELVTVLTAMLTAPAGKG
ncbi:helix-turn-helix domain-containing protein [Streptomyces sp. NPDC000410]|uniref:TetR/AcrR family transcriptional regulator n=1 Tax=Streptomyces sp. NPDC000410 TaxID=3154254 RepID=UPI003326E252